MATFRNGNQQVAFRNGIEQVAYRNGELVIDSGAEPPPLTHTITVGTVSPFIGYSQVGAGTGNLVPNIVEGAEVRVLASLWTDEWLGQDQFYLTSAQLPWESIRVERLDTGLSMVMTVPEGGTAYVNVGGVGFFSPADNGNAIPLNITVVEDPNIRLMQLTTGSSTFIRGYILGFIGDLVPDNALDGIQVGEITSDVLVFDWIFRLIGGTIPNYFHTLRVIEQGLDPAFPIVNLLRTDASDNGTDWIWGNTGISMTDGVIYEVYLYRNAP